MDKLNILWTTDNKHTALNMLTLYAINSKRHNWWKNVNVIVWGASASLIANDQEIQTEVLEMISQGVTVEACKVCSDNLEATAKLLQLGIDVKYMGEPLTQYLKSDDKILTI